MGLDASATTSSKGVGQHKRSGTLCAKEHWHLYPCPNLSAQMATSVSRDHSSNRSKNASPAPSATQSLGSAPPDKQESIPAAYTSDKAEDSSKLKTFLTILRKFVGISDLASVRFSLPAQLLEPTPNLEYWNYLDRPETFVAIGDSDDGLGRMLEVLRFWFTKDLKYVKGKPCKPYNSVLGEFFRCNWEVADSVKPVSEESRKESSQHHIDTEGKQIRISYLTEQTSHHPPVSAFYIDCPVKGISARGFDQLSAKFTGTSIRVIPGAHNLGIFINIEPRGDEEYQLTHPIAHLSGIIRGSLSVTVADTCFITCPKTKQKTILEYMEEGWLGKAQNKIKGVVFTYDPDDDTKMKIRDVPEKDILASLHGSWHGEIFYAPAGSKVTCSLPQPNTLRSNDIRRTLNPSSTYARSSLPPNSYPQSPSSHRMNRNASGPPSRPQ